MSASCLSADDPLRSEPVVILNHQLWQNRLSADPDIVGKTLTMDCWRRYRSNPNDSRSSKSTPAV